jgi:hypothetical protein
MEKELHRVLVENHLDGRVELGSVAREALIFKMLCHA